MHAIVVGGGIGGLATAIGLGRRGWDVTVLERQPQLGAIGAGLSLWPNALRALDRLGIGAAVESAGGRMPERSGMRAADGRYLSRVDLTGHRLVVVHRADLHEILAGALPPSVTVRTGVEVADVDALDADLIVGADGIRSRVRAHCFPNVGIRDSGQVSWRAIVPDLPITSGGETVGPRGWRFGAAPTGRGVYWYVAAPGPLRTGSAEEQLEELRERLKGWHDPIGRLLAATDPAALLHHPLQDLHPVAPMRSGDRVALVGDAAHAMTPNLGQGACQALEDAVTLAALAPDLGRYAALREPRVRRIVERSWQMGRLVGAKGRLTGAVVRTAARLLPDRLAASSALAVTEWEPPAPATPAGAPR